MRHARLAAAQPVGEERAHDRPAQAGAVADRVIDLRDGRVAVVDQPQCLAPQRLEQPVGQESVDLAAQYERMHAQSAVDLGGTVDGRRRRQIAAAALDQRQQVHGIERMPDREALRVLHLGLE